MSFSMRRATTAATVALVLLAGPGLGAEEVEPVAESGFAGTWMLVAAKDDVAAKTRKGGWNVLGGAEGTGSGNLRTAGGGFDLPLEVMTDARRLVVADDGETLRVTYPSGRKRIFITDGGERTLDDGDGPARVTARRRDAVVSVASEWLRGYKLREAWEVRANPRRLVVSGKLKGRESQQYVREYEPAPAEEPSAPVGATGGSPSSTKPGESTDVSPPPAAVDRLSECSIHPPRKASPEELSRLVRVSQEEAGKAAIASLAPLKPGDVISSEVEPYEGCLVWPFTLRLPSRKGVQEIFVDAGDGKIVWSEFVPMGSPKGDTPNP